MRSNLGLGTCGADLGTIVNLRSLSLDNNNLKHLPAEIAALTCLTFLNLSNNQFVRLPVDILGKMTNLVELVLENTPNLQFLPESLGALASLKVLRINPSNFVTPPKAFFEGGPLMRARTHARTHSRTHIHRSSVADEVSLSDLALAVACRAAHATVRTGGVSP